MNIHETVAALPKVGMASHTTAINIFLVTCIFHPNNQLKQLDKNILTLTSKPFCVMIVRINADKSPFRS